MKNKTSPNQRNGNDANRLLAAGWILVTEQLPEYGIAVLVCHAGDENTVEICRLESKTERKESISHEWIIGKTGQDSWYYDVTHWQHLPACS